MQNLFWPFLQFCWREDISNNKERQSIFASWDKDSYTERFLSIAFMHKCITTRNDSLLPDLFTTSWSPSRIDLCLVKVTVLVPLQWGHQTLSSFGFPTYPYSSHMCSLLVCDPSPTTLLPLP
jgi:hypothetical protein